MTGFSLSPSGDALVEEIAIRAPSFHAASTDGAAIAWSKKPSHFRRH
jgi:hypothetical protein